MTESSQPTTEDLLHRLNQGGLPWNDMHILLQRVTVPTVCEHCQQTYGAIPEHIEMAGMFENQQGQILYTYNPHCIPCGQCESYFPKNKGHKPSGDAKICEACYQAHKATGSSYIFEDELGDID